MIEKSAATITAGARSMKPRNFGEAKRFRSRVTAMSYSRATSAGACVIEPRPHSAGWAPWGVSTTAPLCDLISEVRANEPIGPLLTDALRQVVHPLADVLGVVVPVDRLVVRRELLRGRVVREVVLGEPLRHQFRIRLANDPFVQLRPGAGFETPAFRRELRLVAETPVD